MPATFSDLVKSQRSQGQGVFSSLAAAAGSKSLEKIDPRNYLFNRKGSLAALFPGLKGYQAQMKQVSSNGNSPIQTEILSNKLDGLDAKLAIIARNSMSLPLLASETNIMQKNVAKLVKIQGGTPSQKADSFFSSAKFRENAYEASLRKTTGPTKVGGNQQGTKGEGGGFLSGLMNFFSQGLLSLLIKGGIITGIIYGISKYFQDDEFRTSVNSMLSSLWGSISPKFKETLMNGAFILIGAIVAVKASLILLEQALKAAAARMVGGFGAAGKGTKGAPRKGGGRFGTLLGLATVFGAGALGYGLTKDDETFEGVVDPNTGMPINMMPQDQGMSGLAGGGLGLAAGAGVYGANALFGGKLDAMTESKRGAAFKYNEKAGRITQNNVFVKAKDLPQGKIIEKMRTFAVKASKKGWMSRIFSKIVSRVGISLALKVATFLAGLAAAPFTAGLSTLLSIATAAFLVYDLYLLYDLFFGEDGIEKQLEDEDAMKGKTPTITSDPSQVSPGSFASTSPTSTSDSFNLIGNSGLRSFLGLKPRNENELTFNQLTREQQDAVLKAQREQEGFKPGSLTYDLNNPGAILYTSKASAFGGVPDTTGRGVGELKGKFAKFPTLEDGIEAQRDLWSRKYGNMPIQDVVKMWTGGEQGANSNYANALMAAATGKASAPGLSSSSSSSGTQVAQASSAAADAKMQMAAAQPVLFNDIKFIDSLAKASSGSGGGSLDRAMPYDRDWYMGVVRTQAL